MWQPNNVISNLIGTYLILIVALKILYLFHHLLKYLIVVLGRITILY